LLQDDGSERVYREAAERAPERVAAQRREPLSDLQRDLLWATLSRAAEHDKEAAAREFDAATQSVADAAVFVRRRMSQLLAQAQRRGEAK